MLRIAICDDMKFMRDDTKKHVLAYMQHRNLECMLYEYASGPELLKDGKEYDLIFMDYQFENDENNNGIIISRKIRKIYSDVKIIFLSSYPNKVFQTFEVDTFRFLVKPINEKLFVKAMDDFLETLEEDEVLTIKTEGIFRRLYLKNITYIEGYGKYCIIHVNSKTETEFECHETLGAIEKRITKEGFIRCHKSFIVNCNYIESYSHTNVILENGDEVFISKKRYKMFAEQYANFLRRYSRLG